MGVSYLKKKNKNKYIIYCSLQTSDQHFCIKDMSKVTYLQKKLHQRLNLTKTPL